MKYLSMVINTLFFWKLHFFPEVYIRMSSRLDMVAKLRMHNYEKETIDFNIDKYIYIYVYDF